MTRRYVHRRGEARLREIRPNLFGALVEGDLITLVRWEFKPGTPRSGLHVHHDHEQVGVLLAGSIEIEIGGDLFDLSMGDIYWIPRHVQHGHTCVLGSDTAVVLDIWSPPRRDLTMAAHGGAPADPLAQR